LIGRRYGIDMVVQGSPFRGFNAIGYFLFFGAGMASLAGMSLVWRGTFLDHLWMLNARAYRQLAPFGNAVGIAFLLLGATLAIAGAGWFRRRFWGWSLAVIIIAVQVVGNLVSAIRGDYLRSSVGSILAGALLYFLFRPQVRTVFAKEFSSGLH
jgi:hypothetical protein